MSTQSVGAGPGSSSKSQPEYLEFIVYRDTARPLSFAGVELARATRQSGAHLVIGVRTTVEAAIYKTRGGKFITTLTKSLTNSGLEQAIEAARQMAAPFMSPDGEPAEGSPATPQGGYRKAAAHETFEDAMAWFRPGRLTDELRRQLGLDEPERIE